MTDVNPNRWGEPMNRPQRGRGTPALKGGEEVSLLAILCASPIVRLGSASRTMTPVMNDPALFSIAFEASSPEYVLASLTRSSTLSLGGVASRSDKIDSLAIYMESLTT
jgi:hypothetical protein